MNKPHTSTFNVEFCLYSPSVWPLPTIGNYKLVGRWLFFWLYFNYSLSSSCSILLYHVRID